MNQTDAVAFIERWQKIVVSRLCGYRDCENKCRAHAITCTAHASAGGRLNSWKRSNRERYQQALKALGKE